jgi:hypothetical protein
MCSVDACDDIKSKLHLFSKLFCKTIYRWKTIEILQNVSVVSIPVCMFLINITQKSNNCIAICCKLRREVGSTLSQIGQTRKVDYCFGHSPQIRGHVCTVKAFNVGPLSKFGIFFQKPLSLDLM